MTLFSLCYSETIITDVNFSRSMIVFFFFLGGGGVLDSLCKQLKLYNSTSFDEIKIRDSF